jgi:hypothetical protein
MLYERRRRELTSSSSITPTAEEQQQHRIEVMKHREKQIQWVKQQVEEKKMSEERKNEEIRLTNEGHYDQELGYTNILCPKCGKFTLWIYGDFLGGFPVVCKNSECRYENRCIDKEYRIVECLVKDTNRKHNLEETIWGRIIENEIHALK